ncbi:MAG TPA: hypothetical protein VLQ78_13730 [Ornithinibacter sp.]|nr:hypothetical protein [Ornithinibacter sp.]
MVTVVLGMLFCVALALAVVALVAVPARRQGRDVLSERGEDIVGSLRERQGSLRERQLSLGRGERDDQGPASAEARLDEPVAASG